VYFISYYLVASVLILSVLTSFILEAFMSQENAAAAETIGSTYRTEGLHGSRTGTQRRRLAPSHKRERLHSATRDGEAMEDSDSGSDSGEDGTEQRGLGQLYGGSASRSARDIEVSDVVWGHRGEWCGMGQTRKKSSSVRQSLLLGTVALLSAN
jgi:hypothetical protein